MPSGTAAFLPTPPDGVAAIPLWLRGVDEGLLHPTPTGGFRGRLITLFTLSTLYTLLAATYGIYTILRTEERPRRKAVWCARLVSRPTGRFIVLNPRMAWSIGGVVTGLWSISLVWYNYRAFLQDGDQAAMWGVRAMNHFVFFVVGWPISWAGCQAYLLTAENPNSRLPTARKANLIFVVVGLFLAACSFGFGMLQSTRGRQYWFAGGALRSALVECLQASPSGAPTTAQMDILVPLADKTAKTWQDLKTATIIHASFSPIMPIACLIVNAGGCALVYKLRRQVRESSDLLTLSQPGRFTSDDPADWRGPSPTTSSVMMTLDGSSASASAKILPPSLGPISVCSPREGGGKPAQKDQQLTTLQNLKRAELDMTALTIFFIISCLAYTAAFIMADFVMSVDAANTWPLAEGAFGASLWSTVIMGPVLYAFLLYNSASDRLISVSTRRLSNSSANPEEFVTASGLDGSSKSRLALFVPTLKRNPSTCATLMSEKMTSDRPRDIVVTVQVRTEQTELCEKLQ
ncbi:uncharacterized protein JCM15063_003767 [Sporobolomyces koalae]|uniref:uncharacterized protein n=1 Tax=Sporobolomyces koalae TaxID=500713 RepID=UPI00317352D9